VSGAKKEGSSFILSLMEILLFKALLKRLLSHVELSLAFFSEIDHKWIGLFLGP
jgi:hypothetical protein